MRSLSFAVVTACVLVASGCFVETHGGDPHRGWWEERHWGEAY